jgi:ribosome modulation factor
MKTQKQLIEAGYQAALAGKPCEAPTAKERDRAAWEQGWRAGNAQKTRAQGHPR